MKRTIYVLTCLLVALWLPGLVSAQSIGDDFTNHIINPGFEGDQYILDPAHPGGGVVKVPEGWLLDYDLPGWSDLWAGPTNDENCPPAEGDQYFNGWSSDIRKIDLHQKIELPAGGYTLTAMMRVTNTDPSLIINQRIYAKAGDRLVESRVLSEKGIGTEWDELSLVFTVFEEDDSVTIGAISTSTGTDKGWFQLDDVRIRYYGDAEDVEVNILQTKLLELFNECSNLMNGEWLTSGGSQLIGNASQLYELYEASTDIEQLTIAVDSLQAIITEIAVGEALSIELFYTFEEGEVLINASNTYPGLPQLKDALDEAVDYLTTSGRTPEGELVYSSDLRVAIANLEEALRAYRLTQPASADSPADYTWIIQHPHFTKKRGKITDPADLNGDGWETNNVAVNGDFKLANLGGLNCYNNWSNNFTTLDLFQDLIVPSGIYSLECKTTCDAPVTDNHAYAKSTAGITNSPVATYWYNQPELGGNPITDTEWEPLATGKVFVGTDGKLRIGFASTSGNDGASGWFCATDFVLKYYGADPDGYANALDQKIKESEGMTDSLILGAEMAQLKASIEVGKAAVGKDVTTIEAAFAVMNEAMNLVPLSYTTLKAYNEEKNNILDDLGNTLENEASIDLVMNVTELQDQVIKADTTSYPTANALKEVFQSFRNYVKIYDTAPEFIQQTDLYSAEAIQTLEEVLAAQVQILEKSVVYKEEMDKLTTACRSAINALRTSVEAGEDTDFSFLIINPGIDIEGDDLHSIPNGWTITRNTGTTLGRGAHYSGNESNTYLDSWAPNSGDLVYTAQQKIVDLPNGTYRLEAVGRSSGNGAAVFAIAKDSMYEEIPFFNDLGGSVWEEAPEDSDIKQQNGRQGFGWNKVVIDNIVVWSNSMVIGTTTDPKLTGMDWDGYWFSCDEFRLFYISTDWNVGVEDINSDSNSDALKAYSVNGTIVVEGVKDFTVYTLSGASVPSPRQLAPGIYIVKAGAKTTKVAVQ